MIIVRKINCHSCEGENFICRPPVSLCFRVFESFSGLRFEEDFDETENKLLI